MGICWGDPHFPTPTHTACLKSRMNLTIISTSSSETSQSLLDLGSTSGSNKAFTALGHTLEVSSLTVFSFTELKAATKNFGDDTLVGEGGFGKVFKGLIDEKATSGSGKSIIAVKKLDQGGFQGHGEWQTEIMFMGRLSHPNIAKLLGYCHEGQQLLLVYEFASKGSLNNHLFGRGSIAHPLPWYRRLKIAIGAARGLAFLHTCEKKIIYRDVKTANILLDGSYNAKLSDFGLARFGPSEGESHVSTRVMGTFGYAAPEYVATGRLSIKSDVYGFGVVLLELLMGRQVIDRNLPAKEKNLVTWSQKRLPRKRHLVAMMDPKLNGGYPLQGATEVAQLALRCVRGYPDQRPSMTEVVEELEKIEAASAGSNYQ